MKRFACLSALVLLCPTSVAAQSYSQSGAGTVRKGDYGDLVEKAAEGQVRLEDVPPSAPRVDAPPAHRSLARVMADLDDDRRRGRGLYLHSASEFADEPHRVGLVDRANWDRDFLPANVAAPRGLPVGDVLIDTEARQLYVGLGQGMARRYGIAVGKEGAAWKGTATVSRKARWPDWHPTEDMRRKDRRLGRLVEGGERNPLGARAIYLDIGGADSLYRIHGTTAPSSIGHAASHGCIRMLNEDVIELYPMVKQGATVYVE